jgi:hypothetical protein
VARQVGKFSGCSTQSLCGTPASCSFCARFVSCASPLTSKTTCDRNRRNDTQIGGLNLTLTSLQSCNIAKCKKDRGLAVDNSVRSSMRQSQGQPPCACGRGCCLSSRPEWAPQCGSARAQLWLHGRLAQQCCPVASQGSSRGRSSEQHIGRGPPALQMKEQ